MVSTHQYSSRPQGMVKHLSSLSVCDFVLISVCIVGPMLVIIQVSRRRKSIDARRFW
jgi:hypothetical protein